MAGTDDAEDPPVPIPNTVVKLCGAEDTWLETAWENRKAPAFSDKRPCRKDYSFPQGFFLFARFLMQRWPPCGVIPEHRLNDALPTRFHRSCRPSIGPALRTKSGQEAVCCKNVSVPSPL